MAPRLTLVTLDCRPFDITKSVSEPNAPVYSPAVLRLRYQPLRHDRVTNSAVVQMTDVERNDFDRWLRRATAAGGIRVSLIDFGGCAVGMLASSRPLLR